MCLNNSKHVAKGIVKFIYTLITPDGSMWGMKSYGQFDIKYDSHNVRITKKF